MPTHLMVGKSEKPEVRPRGKTKISRCRDCQYVAADMHYMLRRSRPRNKESRFHQAENLEIILDQVCVDLDARYLDGSHRIRSLCEDVRDMMLDEHEIYLRNMLENVGTDTFPSLPAFADKLCVDGDISNVCKGVSPMHRSDEL